MSENIKKDDDKNIVSEESEKPEENETETEVIDFEAKLKKTEEMLKIEKEKYVQVYADFANRSKRVDKEKQSAIDYSSEKFAMDLLPIIDSLGLALLSANSANTETDPKELLEKLKEGINLTLDNFEKTFSKNGIESIAVDGEFDPNFHQAIQQMDSEKHEDGHIISTMQKGYTLKGRVLRAAMVAVCKK